MKAIKYIWIFCLILDYFVPNQADDHSEYKLSSITDYVVFSGDIDVSCVLPSDTILSNAVFELITLPSSQLIQMIELPNPISSTARFSFACGSIDKPGTYLFRMRNQRGGDILADSEELTARWPDIHMQIPPEHETSTGSVSVSFRVDETVACNSQNASVEYKFEVRRYQNIADKTKFSLMHHHNVTNFNIYNGNAIKLECSIFDEAGIYDVILTSNRDPVNTMATSNDMDVTWSSEYAVSVIPKSVLPCEDQFAVQFEQPDCPGRDNKIKLYREVRQSDSSVPGLISLEYIAEQRARPGKWEVYFECQNFHVNDAGYCFKFYSTARSQATNEQDSICLPTTDTPVPVVDGSWSDWAAWSGCSASCAHGRRVRHRSCDHPEPSGGGVYCSGETSQSQLCGVMCEAATTQPPKVYTPMPNCGCGCQVATSRGTIVSSVTCRGSSVWIITAPRDHIIALTFQQYTLDARNSATKVYVRDGGTRQSDLLISDSGLKPPTQVETSQHQLWLEFVAPYERSSDIYGVSNEGFAATFVTYVNNRTGGHTEPGSEWSMWATTMLLIGVLICIIIIVCAVGFICYHHHNQKSINQKLQQANQALLVNGDAPNSPGHSHSGGTVKGSANISFADPVSSPTKSRKRDYIVAKSEPTTPVKATDVEIRVKHKKASPSKGGRSPSKQRLSRSYTNGLSSHANKNSDASVPVVHASHTPSPTYVNSSQGYIPVKHLADRPKNSNKPLSPRNDKRNKSFISAVERGPQGVPMADAEDLSPATPTEMYQFHQKQPELIPMESFYNSNQKQFDGRQIADTPLYEQRPPVEGRDSLTRKKSKENIHDPVKIASQMPSSPRRNTNYVPPLAHRPDIKPLPLRSIQRPDGQSPDSKQNEVDTYSPQSQQSSGLSPMLLKTALFPSRTQSQLDLPVDPDFEYDDSIYVPGLPGSYFNMDPGAYTLTWQQHPSWQGKPVQPRTESQQTLNSNNNGSFC